MVRLLKPTDEDLDYIRSQLKWATIWEMLMTTPHGKSLVEFYDAAIQDCKHNWESTGLSIDEDKLVAFRRSLVSKMQTLKALRDKLIHASEEKQRLERELQGENK